ncbi:glycine--tRNA ligase [Candidatus Micrarchaeota archaeon]|nr:glycine--tRNA ligase [Candidatus Micrarchaeota archaeon]
MAKDERMEKVVNLLERRGFLFASGQIYGTMAGFFDFGNYGTLLKRKIEQNWWNFFVDTRHEVVGIDGSIVSSSAIWNASGHLAEFSDPLIECKKCRAKFRADSLIEDELKISVEGKSLDNINKLIIENKLVCQNCKGELEIASSFNLMFKTQVGASEDESSIAYLRPETAQMIFINFKQVQMSSRKKLPFGIAQIGKAFRNEISPRNFVFRCREFSQMEMEFFVHPEKLDECQISENELDLEINALTEKMQESKENERKTTFASLLNGKSIGTKWHAYWIIKAYEWFLGLGIKKENLRIRQHVKTELSHYSSETWDLEYNYPWGWKELSGIANRGDFDLKQHMLGSKKDLTYFDDETKAKVLPVVIEPSFGLERALLTVIIDAFEEKLDGEEKKTILHLNSSVAPIEVAIFPLMKKDGLAQKALEIFGMLRKNMACEYDEAGSIGRRYARQDEIGTPYCLTIDYDTLKDETITIRERDSTLQKRIKINECVEIIGNLLKGGKF